MASKREQRQNPRIVTEGLPGKMAFSLEASVLNVSRGGLAIQTRHQLRIASRYRIQIGGDEHSFDAMGTVRRCRLKGTRKGATIDDFEPLYEAGIEFDPPLSEKTEELLSAMARSASIQLAPRLFGRFIAPEDSSATLESDLDFEVKKISLSGLLTESEGPPWPGESVEMEILLGDESFTCAGQIVNTETFDDDEGQRTQYGVKFVEPEESEFERLESFVLGRLKEDF